MCSTPPASGQDEATRPHPPSEDSAEPSWRLASGRTLRFVPAGDVYPVYLADPHKPESAALAHLYTRTTVYDSTGARFGLKAGGRFGILRLDPARAGGRSWQLSFDAGLDAQFDSNHKQDSLGWDGNYGFTLTTATGGPVSLKLGALHVSSHVGDEYAERTGRMRIDYTRAELAFGVARRLPRRLRAYGEIGWGYHLLTEEQEPWRVQAGLEFESRRSLLGGRFAWYVAVDFQAMQERDWRLDFAIQAGLTTSSHGRRWRFGLQYDDGRVPLGEFFAASEAWVTFGVWLDL